MPQNTHVQNVLALSIVVIIDWFIAHLAPNWVLPPEVAQAFQTIVSVAIGAYVMRNHLTLPNGNGNGNGGNGAPSTPPTPDPALTSALTSVISTKP